MCGTLFLYNKEMCKAPKCKHRVSAKEEEDKEKEKKEETSEQELVAPLMWETLLVQHGDVQGIQI